MKSYNQFYFNTFVQHSSSNCGRKWWFGGLMSQYFYCTSILQGLLNLRVLFDEKELMSRKVDGANNKQ